MEKGPKNGTKTIFKTWQEVQSDLEPFSLVLFRGSDFVSRTITDIESVVMNDDAEKKYGLWSHCGVLVNGNFMKVKNLKPNQWAVFEMTCSGSIASDSTPNLITGKGKFGTQVRDLESLLHTYSGSVAILKLKLNIIDQCFESDIDYQFRMEKLADKVTKFYKKNEKTLYQLNLIRLLSSAFKQLRFLRKYFPFSKYWKMCSDLTASFYKDIGIISKDIDTEDVLPIDFISDTDETEIHSLFCLPAIQIKLA